MQDMADKSHCHYNRVKVRTFDMAMKKIATVSIWVTAALAVVALVLVAKVTLIPPGESHDGYNYNSYRQIEEDSARVQGPDVGEPFPRDVEVLSGDGEAIPIQSLWADKPLVLEFGSVSCPIFHGNGPSMEEIFRKYDNGNAENARIGLLYVREAHPGWLQHSHRTLDDKLENARKLKDKGLDRAIWVDSVNGELHRKLNPLPNSVYIVDTNGTVVYKSSWNVPREVDEVLDALVNSNSGNQTATSNYCGDPSRYYGVADMLAYIGRIVVVGGPDALADFLVNEMLEDDSDESSIQCVNESTSSFSAPVAL